MDAIARFSMGAAAAALLSGGCSPGASPAEDTAAVRSAAIVPNGVFFNGTFFNGIQLDPLRLEGLHLAGQAFAQVTLDGASLVGVLPGGVQVSGSGLRGAELSASLADGSPLTLRIDDVTAGTDPGVNRYSVSAHADGSDAYQPLCGLAADGTAVEAIPLSGTWDTSEGTPTGGAHIDDARVFTFACEGYALAKCVDFGYAPWRTVTECEDAGDCATRSLAPFHQACTRLLRADYCGDGTATTRDGTPVELWDRFGLQTDAAPAWSFEAEWGAGGAICVDRTRWTTIEADGGAVQAYILDHCADRWETAGCGGAGSTFFTTNGFDVPLAQRVLLRSRIDGTQ